MKRIWRAFLYSMSGIKLAYRDEAAFREEAILAIIMIPAAFYFAPDKISLILMVASVLIVLSFELLNSAIEAAIDRQSTELHPLAKKAKDTASAAVFFALVMTGFVWAMILFF
jgi:diacylglycerol kinase (ATP)